MTTLPRPWRTVGRIGVGLVTVVSVSLGLGMLLWSDADQRLAPYSADAGAASGSAVEGQLDERTRVSTVSGVQLTLPEGPYLLDGNPMRIPGVLDPAFLAGALVHRDYDGHRDWYAEVFFGALSDSEPVDLDAQARQAAEQLSRIIFDAHPTQLRHVEVFDHAVDGRPGVLLTASVRYRVRGLASRSDALRLQLVRTDAGQTVAAVSSVPDDAPASVTALAEQALQSMRFR